MAQTLARRRSAALLSGLCVVVLVLLWPSLSSGAVDCCARRWYVDPLGDDAADGQDPSAALQHINAALAVATPGDTVHLASGLYVEDVRTVRSGTPEAPITITGPASAVVAGSGAGRIVEIRHSWLRLVGFTVDGAAAGGPLRDKLIFAIGPTGGLSGLQVLQMTLANAGGECVRLRSAASRNEIAHNVILNCGGFDFPAGRWAGGDKNGEGVYVGTAASQWGDGKNASAGPDPSNENWIHHNLIDTRGSECVEIKEGAERNIVEHNRCTGQLDPKSAGLVSRGDRNVLRFNVVSGSAGAGIRIGGHTVNGVVHGRANDVYGNRLLGNEGGGLALRACPQGLVANNATAPVERTADRSSTSTNCGSSSNPAT